MPQRTQPYGGPTDALEPARVADDVTPRTTDAVEVERWTPATLRRIVIGGAAPELAHSFLRWLFRVHPQAAPESGGGEES